jgi:acyl-CoA thioesterase FadM
MFQTLERVLNMDATGSSCGARHVRASHYFAKTHDQTLLLGDPLLRDALLQTAQLSTRSTVLPIGIDELDLYDLSWSEAPSVMILNKVVARSEVGPTCDVLAQGSTGKPLERLVGYRLKQMDRDESGPEPGDWANPTQRDSATLRSVLAKHCQRFGLAAPHWSLTFVPHLSEQGRAERRLLEAPLLLAVGQVASPRSPALEVGWREDGKPLFVGMSTDELDVALSHDDSYCLCVAGLGAQGCDLESIEPRSREGWLRLIGAEHDQLLEQLIALGEPLDDAGTRLWCTLETLTKAGQGRRIAKLEKQDEGVLFTPQEPGVVRVLTFSVSLTRLPKRVAALLLRPAAPSPSPSPGTSSRRSVARAPELLQRFRSTFKDTAGARGGVKPAIFADWMGTIRELSVASVANELISDFASGRWGMVTNYSNVRILRDIACLEEIEARLRFTRAYGKFGSSIDLHFDWSRVGADGSLQEVARADMGTTWVEIVGHGVVEVRPFPDYMDRLVKSYLPEPSVIVPEPIVPDLTAFGAAIYTAPNAPRVKPELGRHRFSTSLAESNLVGNIYYANYYGWQSQALGRFLHELQSAGGWGGSRGSLSCTFCAVAHLREAMPFDQIEVVMGLRGLYERGLELHFDFYKVREGSQSVKLATGQYQALWIDGVSDRVADLPRDYVAGFTQFSSAAAE